MLLIVLAMPYLIDGHNLIGQMRTIQLADPDDEAKLVMILQRFAMRRQVSVAVVFDRGQYTNRTLGGAGVSVRFARSSTDADTIIKTHLVRLARPADWVLVSSDRAITEVAAQVGTKIISSHEFADILENLDAPSPDAINYREVHAHVRPDQVDEWLQLFGIDPDTANKQVDLTRKPKKPTQSTKQPTQAKKKPKPPVVLPEPPQRWQLPPQRKNTPDPVPREADGRPRKSRGGPDPHSSEGERLMKPPPPVHPDEIEEWLDFFGVDE